MQPVHRTIALLAFAAVAVQVGGRDGLGQEADPLRGPFSREANRTEDDFREQATQLGGCVLAKGFKSSWSPDGKRIVFGLQEQPFRDVGGGLQILDVASGEISALLDSGKDPAWSPAADGPIAYVDGGYGADEQVWLIDATGENSRKVAVGGFPSWSPDGRRLYFHTRTDGTIRSVAVQDPDTWATPRMELATSCWYPVVSPDGKRIASSRGDQPFVVDRETGKEEQRWQNPGLHGLLFGWSADGKQVGAGGYGHRDNTGLWICDVASGRMKRVLEGPATMPTWSPDGSKLCFDMRFPTGFEVWMIDAKVLEERPWFTDPLAPPPQPPTVRAIVDPTPALTLTGHTDQVIHVTFSPDGKRIATASDDRTAKVWDAETGTLIETLAGHAGPVIGLAFSPDGKTLASASWDASIKIWDVETGQVRRTLKGHGGPVWSVAFSPDGQKLASGSYDGTVKLWDVHSGELAATLTGHTNRIYGIAFSPDGKTLASASWDKTVKLWDVASCQLRQTLEGHTNCCLAVAFSSDGKTLASSGEDRTIKVWDVPTGELQRTLPGHAGSIWTLAFMPGENILASGGWHDHAIQFWDVRTGELCQTVHEHAEPVRSVAFSPLGKAFASASNDRTVKVFRIFMGDRDLQANVQDSPQTHVKNIHQRDNSAQAVGKCSRVRYCTRLPLFDRLRTTANGKKTRGL